MDAQPQAFDACLKEALVQTREWVPRWLDKLHATLKDKELSARHLNDKQGLVEARTALETHRDLIAVKFIESLADAVRLATYGDYSTALPKLNLPQRQISIRVRLDPSVREDLAAVEQLLREAEREVEASS